MLRAGRHHEARDNEQDDQRTTHTIEHASRGSQQQIVVKIHQPFDRAHETRGRRFQMPAVEIAAKHDRAAAHGKRDDIQAQRHRDPRMDAREPAAFRAHLAALRSRMNFIHSSEVGITG
jgi:hypothetical protein